jgi:phage baseplate assembly protein W
MPIPQTIRVNPLDLQGNIAIGISLPFSGPFNSTYSTKDQIKSNLINLLLTNKGERLFNPDFGANLKTTIFEGVVEDTAELIKELITYNVSLFMPEITITNINTTKSEEDNTILVAVYYRINISGTVDQITVEFI